MKILTAIRREERQLEKQVIKLKRRLGAMRAAARVLGGSGNDGVRRVKKRVLSAAGRARIARAARKRWAKVRAQAKKATS
jgi:hypothetical protein